jgi:mannitol/fructose-specific phosphotransferase system IIA component (Ntr-type)
MMPTEPLFSPGRINLDLTAPDRDAALQATAEMLSGDARVGNWDEFWSSIGARQVVDLADCTGHVMIAHGRGTSIADLALAAARWSGPDGPCLIFVFAIPAAMSGEYLRKVGALARFCREPEKLASLLSAATAENFAALLEEWTA